jgi:hypothetical protein
MTDTGSEDQPEPLAREGQHIPPGFRNDAFHCVYCGVLAEQRWLPLMRPPERGRVGQAPSDVWIAQCKTCYRGSVWLESSERMIEPLTSGGPRPHAEMPDDVRADYEEARGIVSLSPRGACALLRLAVQRLADDLIPGSGKLDAKIGTLVEQRLPDEVARALDILRVVGNNAVHPGEMDLDDDVETAAGLFECLNVIVEDRIARPKRIGGLFDKLPDRAKQGIARRDKS